MRKVAVLTVAALTTGTPLLTSWPSANDAAYASPFGQVTRMNLPEGQVTTDGWGNGMQGVAVGGYKQGKYIFFSTKDRIRGWRVDDSSRYGLDHSRRSPRWEWGVPTDLPGEPHFGDLDYDENVPGTSGADLVYVPYEDNTKSNHPRLAVFRIVGSPGSAPGHTYVGSDVLDDLGPGRDMPWVAIKNGTQCVYTSGFRIQAGQQPFGVTEYCDTDSSAGVNMGPPVRHRILDRSGNEMSLDGVQGGDFIVRSSNIGYLFLLAQGGPESAGAGRGIYVFQTRTNMTGDPFVMIDFLPAEMHPGRNEEYEGMTVGDVDPVGENNRAQIHALVVRNPPWWEYPWGDHDFYFKHWRVQHAAGMELP